MAETLSLTETIRNVVPMPGLVWCWEFTFLRVEAEDPVHKVFAIALAHLANINVTKENKDGSWNAPWATRLQLHHLFQLAKYDERWFSLPCKKKKKKKIIQTVVAVGYSQLDH